MPDGNITPFPGCKMPEAQSSAGLYGFSPPDAIIDITPGIDGYRVWIGAKVYASFMSATNALRCVGALEELRKLGVLPVCSARDHAPTNRAGSAVPSQTFNHGEHR